MKIRIVRISNGEVRVAEFKGLATSKGTQVLVKMGSLLTYYKFHTRSGLGTGKAKGFALIGNDLHLVRDQVQAILTKRRVAEELRRTM